MLGDDDDARSAPLLSPVDSNLIAGRYELRSRLGSGGMGEVYAGYDRELDREVAVKLPPQARINDAIWIDRFLRQAKAMARIDHPGVVRVYDRGLHEGRVPYVVMELLRGQDLAQLLRAQGALPVSSALELGEQLADAVAELHTRDVLHRDLKPANVLLPLAKDGSLRRLKLVDFGLAKVPTSDELTGSSELLGTLPYLAPELLDGIKDASPASDLYALGCILFELVIGRRAFPEQGQSALLHAIRTRSAPAPRELIEGLPVALDTLIQSLMSKVPSARPTACEVRAQLARIPRVHEPALLAPAARVSVRPGTLLSQRFELVRVLGEGRQGIVYEAHDRVSQSRIALKWLRTQGADDVYRLKREYRLVSELAHPNLVRIGELFVEDSAIFLTMELVSGDDFMLRASASHDALRRAIVQVCRGLFTLHERGLVHRDLKPSNIRVTAEGRVVLLDFGLATRAEAETAVAGTPRYMAPEALEGKPTSASDMFALGVILYEILTGEAGAERQGSLSARCPDLPADLRLLCDRLLAASACDRPSAQTLLAELEDTSTESSSVHSAESTRRTLCLGRERELSLLLEEISTVAREGALRCVLLHGESGIGKTTVLEELTRRAPETALVLVGRGRDAERIPYPALDSALDALSEHLQKLPHPVARSLLPRDIGALALLFPVLRRVESIAHSPPTHLPKDPLELRTRAFRVFKELLRRIADQRPVLLLLDDVQWIDPDSVALLAYCLAAPDPPALLLTLARRDEPGRETPALDQLLADLALPTRDLALSPLSNEACRGLIDALWHDAARWPNEVERMSAHSGGHPFLLTVLAAHLAQGRERARGNLADALRVRIEALPATARELLERVAVCERPLPRGIFLESCPDAHAALALLRDARLVRRLGGGEGARLDVYHACVREAALSALSPQHKRAHHAYLAHALARRAEDPEAHVEHLEAAGAVREAAEVAVRAASAASALLAFERAASLYERARRLGNGGDSARPLLIAQAQALRNAGRTRQAGQLLLEAAQLAQGQDALSLQREAGHHLLLAGDIEGGLQVLAPLLLAHAISLPCGVEQISAAGTAGFSRLQARGLVPNQPDEGAQQPKLRARLSLMLSLTQALAHCDMRGIACAFDSLELALELGDPATLQRAAALFVICTAAHMNTPLIEPALSLCRALTESHDAYAQALLHAAEGEAQHFSGQFLAAETSFESAERLLLESCVGATRELSTVRNGAVLVQYSHKADFKTHVARTLGWLTDAEMRQDFFHAAVLRVAHAIVWIAHDEPERARRELLRAEAEWAGADGLFEVAAVLYHDIIDRYLGDKTAHLRPVQGRAHVLEGPAIRMSFLGGYVELHRAWGGLRAIAYGDARGGERELVETAVTRMRGLGPGIWQAVAAAFEGNLLFLQGRVPAAHAQLDFSERTFRSLDMRCLAASARHRRGELLGGTFGARMASEAEAELRTLGVVAPLRWCRAYFSVFPPALIDELTLGSAPR